jgi:hypothetical protein
MKWTAMTKILAYVVLVLSAVGIFLCVICFLLGVTGVYQLPENEPFLFFGVFVVWIPTILLMNRLTRDFKQRDLWKAALRGCPAWMRTTLWVVTGLIMASFVLSAVLRAGPGGFPLLFTIFPVTFYGVSFCAMYSYLHVEKFDASRRCLNGHAISPLAKFCEECGAPAAPYSTISTSL